MTQKSATPTIVSFVLTLALSTTFGLYLSSQRVTDPFLYYDVSFVKLTQLEGAMVIPDRGPYASLGYAQGREMLMVQLANMLGVTPEALQFLPLGAIFVSQSLFLLGLRLLKSPVLASLVALYLTFNLSHASALYGVFAYGLGMPLFIGTILIAMRFIGRRSTLGAIVLLLLFIATHLVHYTITIWAIVTLLGANLIVWINKRYRVQGGTGMPAHYLLISFVVIFLGFNQAVYRSFLPLISRVTFESAVQRFLSYSAIDAATVGRSPYLFTRSVDVGLVSAITLLVILAPVAIGVAVDLWRLLARHSPTGVFDSRMALMGGLLLTGLVDSLSYTVRGSVSTKTLSMLFPLLSLYYVQRLNRRVLPLAFAAVLLLLSLIKLGVFYRAAYVIRRGDMSTSLARARPSAAWLQDHSTRAEYTVLSDLNLYGKYLLTSVGQPRQPILAGFTASQFEQVVGSSRNAWGEAPEFVAVDLNSYEPTLGFVWTVLDPLRDYVAGIRANPKVNVIFDDGAILLGKPVER